MEKVDQSNTIQTALRKGAQIIQAAGKTNLATRNKVVKGDLKKSFSVRVVKKKAYALAGFKRPQGAHAHLVDRGTKKRYTARGYYRGSVSKGSPNTGSLFWTDAVNATGQRALEGVMSAIYKSLDEITKRNQR